MKLTALVSMLTGGELAARTPLTMRDALFWPGILLMAFGIGAVLHVASTDLQPILDGELDDDPPHMAFNFWLLLAGVVALVAGFLYQLVVIAWWVL